MIETLFIGFLSGWFVNQVISAEAMRKRMLDLYAEYLGNCRSNILFCKVLGNKSDLNDLDPEKEPPKLVRSFETILLLETSACLTTRLEKHFDVTKNAMKRLIAGNADSSKDSIECEKQSKELRKMIKSCYAPLCYFMRWPRKLICQYCAGPRP